MSKITSWMIETKDGDISLDCTGRNNRRSFISNLRRVKDIKRIVLQEEYSKAEALQLKKDLNLCLKKK